MSRQQDANNGSHCLQIQSDLCFNIRDEFSRCGVISASNCMYMYEPLCFGYGWPLYGKIAE